MILVDLQNAVSIENCSYISSSLHRLLHFGLFGLTHTLTNTVSLKINR